MEILSLAETKSIAREADQICSTAEACKVRLEELGRGAKVTIGAELFSCISSDKNIIYRVDGDYVWYLKFSQQEEWVRREIAGAEAVKATLGEFQGYQHAKSIRASLSEKYTLYSASKGTNFNRSFLHGCVTGLIKSGPISMPYMDNLGRSLGRLHNYEDPGGPDVLSPDTLSYIRTYLGTIKEPGLIVGQISNWVSEQPEFREAAVWIHGNIKSEDIFIADGGISLIDFGTCGTGVRYEDLTNLCTYLMIFRAVPFFPWRIARQAMSTFLRGYAAESAINKNDLYNYITQGVCRYYIKNVVLDRGIASTSGMPVLKSRMERLITQLLRKDFEAAFEGVRF